MRIGEIASASGVPAKTIRFWEAQGLLPDPGRTPAGYRDYEPEIVQRLSFVRSAQAAGLTLREIGQILEIGDRDKPPCEHVRAVAAERLAEVETRIAELEATRRHVERLVRRAAAQDPVDCRGYCSIITG